MLLAGMGTAAALLAFAVGRWTADPPEAPLAGRGPAWDSVTAIPARAFPGRAPEQGKGPAAPIQAPPSAPVAAAAQTLTPQGRPTPTLVARVTEEARSSLEAARADFTGRCIPGRRLPDGQAAATFTFNVTFDASGREIARGIGEDRRYRAPQVARCLRTLPIGSLRVSPPGANVGVRVAMNLP